MKLCAFILILGLVACDKPATVSTLPYSVKDFCYEGITYIWVGSGYGGVSVKMDRNGNVVLCH